MGLLNQSSLAGVAHLAHYGEAVVGGAALVVGTQALSTGLQAGNPLVIEAGVHLVSHAAATVPHVLVGVFVVEAGFAVGSFINAAGSVAGGSCQ
jgi:hypothetical protein